jgi:hypothetical protein
MFYSSRAVCDATTLKTQLLSRNMQTLTKLRASVCLPCPRVDDSQASSVKRRRVARGYGETMRRSDRCDIAVCGRNGLSSGASTGEQRCICSRRRVIKWQDATREQRQDALFKTGMKCIPAFALRPHSDTETQFRKADCREVQRFDDLRVDPSKHVPIDPSLKLEVVRLVKEQHKF